MTSRFLQELTDLLNKYSQENGSDTPDFILAKYLFNCLGSFDTAVTEREDWYGRSEANLTKTEEIE